MGLEQYKDIVGTCATLTAMGQMFSGILICRDMHKKGSSKGVDPMPFLGGIGICILMLRYAWIVGDPAMININVFGLSINSIYMAIYYYYSPQTKDTLALLGKAAAFVMVFLAYAEIESPEKIAYRFGIIVTALFLLLIASPLMHLKEIIRTKNTDILPFPLILMGSLAGFQWLLYGIIINDSFIIFQNAIGLMLSLTQISLFVIFPSKSKSKSKAKTSSQRKLD